MSNIRKAFEQGKAFIPFITCGDPDLETTGAVVRAAVENGADPVSYTHLAAASQGFGLLYHPCGWDLRQRHAARRALVPVCQRIGCYGQGR